MFMYVYNGPGQQTPPIPRVRVIVLYVRCMYAV